MQKLLFATNNKHKLSEVRAILGNKFEIVGLNEFGHFDELAEDGNTLEENALQKARFIYDKYQINCFSEDSGLEVEALNNAPGIHTAMYAGAQRSAEDNINLLLKNLENQSNRKARFRTVIALILDGNEYLFEGEVPGIISEEPQGIGGFGYDPIFIPERYKHTFAELPADIKNTISHRSKATEKLGSFLSKQ